MHQSPTQATQLKGNYALEIRWNPEIRKTGTTIYEVKQFRQKNFNSPYDGKISRNMLREIWRVRTYNLKQLKSFKNINFEF
jgi:hypothetical protein